MPMTTRRYGDEEASEIFRLATTSGTPQQALPGQSDGLTLAELQRIGQEAGIEPAQIAQAAASLDARGRPSPVRRSFGLPIGVSRVVELPRAPTDREWEQLIAEFRTTFGAQGRVTSTGSMREWSVGNLHICVEPTRHGQQLRLSTRKEDASVLNAMSALMAGMATLMGAVGMAAGHPAKALTFIGLFGGMSLASFGANVIRLPRWARERERQMEAIAEHTVDLLSDS